MSSFTTGCMDFVTKHQQQIFSPLSSKTRTSSLNFTVNPESLHSTIYAAGSVALSPTDVNLWSWIATLFHYIQWMLMYVKDLTDANTFFSLHQRYVRFNIHLYTKLWNDNILFLISIFKTTIILHRNELLAQCNAPIIL